jgi:site-specific DNA-methyltransferase (adenine-specific)
MLNNNNLALHYNPDVLTCLANLSNDEVFTPPNMVARMLDLLPAEIWSDREARFLDPVCKSGVFLREIAARLNTGLESQIPDKQTRINHIFKQQLFGLAITDLTALLSRRSVYCSKTANGPYSVCDEFSDEQGNIRFERVQHSWHNGRCQFCGASEGEYSRDETLETHAYQFIHTKQPEELFNMKFDVIVGNPPYQLGSDGGTRDVPIYNKFIEQAKKLNPRFLCMIIPSRWMASGLGLSEFRREMLNDRRIRHLVDYPVASEIFPGVEVKGGVCYFLWERDSEGDCEVTTVRNGEIVGPQSRDMREFDVFVRDSRAINILRKVQEKKELSITEILSVDKEFGWTSNFDGFHSKQQTGDVPLYYVTKGKRGIGWIERSEVKKSANFIDTWKVMIPQAGSDGGQKIPDSVLGQSLIAASPSVCTQSFLFFNVGSKQEAESLDSYLRTRFFRFLVSLRKITQHATRSTYTWVPQQSWDRTWSDDALYKKYGLTKDEIAFIESKIRPMGAAEE